MSMFLADLHVHSQFSDGHLSIPQLVDFYGKRGFGCIAVTDHVCESRSVMGIAARYMKITLTPETFNSYMKTIREEAIRAWEQYQMVLMPGFELTKNTFSNHRSAHILGIGISEFVSPEGDVLDLARQIRAQGALVVAAHPVQTHKAELQTLHLWDRRDELKGEFDAWEIASGDEIFADVAASRFPVIATSDFHRAPDINAWKTVFHCERHAEAIMDSVRKQEVEFHFFRDMTGHEKINPCNRLPDAGLGLRR